MLIIVNVCNFRVCELINEKVCMCLCVFLPVKKDRKINQLNILICIMAKFLIKNYICIFYQKNI
jgi:hypothetical protein